MGNKSWKKELNNDRVNITNSVFPSNFSRYTAVGHSFLPARGELEHIAAQ